MQIVSKKNQDFRAKYGYSPTMSSLMKKYDCRSVEEYRKLRKENKKKFAQTVAPGTQLTKPTKSRAIIPVKQTKRK